MYIFTSPTSANGLSMEMVEADNDGIPPAPKRSKKNLGATRSHVASLIGLRKVTPRSIAYVAVQVSFFAMCVLHFDPLISHAPIKLRFALSSVNAWRVVDIDFNHEEFYTAIVDYFEVTPGPVAQAHVNNLLAWWNRFVVRIC
jgi:hypothetical protein